MKSMTKRSIDQRCSGETSGLRERDIDAELKAANLKISFQRIFSSSKFLKMHSMKKAHISRLSHVGSSVYKTLRRRYFWHARKLWSVTSGRVVELHQIPRVQDLVLVDPQTETETTKGDHGAMTSSIVRHFDFPEGHSDWFPEKIYDLLSRTQYWCDIVALTPPDGLFLEKIKDAIKKIDCNQRDTCLNGDCGGVDGSFRTTKTKVVIRIVFANIIAAPVNCDIVRRTLTNGLPEDSNIQLWVGAWRRRSSWNHAKIIAVDGQHLHTGGYNLWDAHYLKKNPTHDVAVEIEGKVSVDGHLFSDEQWAYIEKKERSLLGKISNIIPGIPMANRVSWSKFPKGAPDFPPSFASKKQSLPRNETSTDLPVITIGRSPALSVGMSGAFVRKARPSDAAFVAMLDSSTKNIRMILQDLGPMTIPGTEKVPLPGGKWPTMYLNALARVIWRKDVKVEIILSNPGSTPGGLSKLAACYGYGWSANDVASEIIKRIKKQFFFTNDVELRRKVTEKLHICYVGHLKSRTYSDGGMIGLHSKFFIVDDVSCYIGSQNLYICDLAEWGVIIDDESQTKKIMQEYWTPMWEGSYSKEHCNVDKVMKRLHIKRDGKYLSPTQFRERARSNLDEALSYSLGRISDDRRDKAS